LHNKNIIHILVYVINNKLKKMITISKEANPNYLCKIIKIDNIRKHNNADKLQIVTVDFQDVVTGMDAKQGDVYVYFPVECKINKNFLSFTNSFRNKELNADKEKAGFFEENCRVKAVKLRGEKSMGYLVPANEVESFNELNKNTLIEYINEEFDTINGIKLVEKYVVKTKQNNPNIKKGKQPKLNRLIDGQVHLHVDTENLRKNIHKINPEDTISITYKTHGTSGWVANVLTKKKLSWFEKVLLKLGVNIKTIEYSRVYGSRKVVKNKYFKDPKNQNHFYEYDIWKDVSDKLPEIPKGYTLYYEILGYTKTGGFIQDNYDYGCNVAENKVGVYRITHTTPDGLVTELSYPEIAEFCEKVGLTPSHLFYYGKAKDCFYNKVVHPDNVDLWRVDFIKHLENLYNEKNCFMSKSSVPEEGIVLRKESLFQCESYKLKSFKFLKEESEELDKGEVNIEDNE